MTTLQTIQNLMAKRFGLSRKELEAGQPLRNLGLDSLAIMEFMFDLEDDFKIKLSDAHPEVNTLQDIVDVIDRLVAAQH